MENQTSLRGPGAPIGVLAQFTVHNQPFTLKIKEKLLSFSGDDFSISTLDGRKFMQVNGEVFSLRGNKHLLDQRGAEIFVIKRKLLSLRGHMEVYSAGPNPTKLIEVYNHFAIMKAKMTVSFTNLDGRPMELQVKGDYFDRNATITLDGVPVARIDRRFTNGGELFFDNQTYYLTVAPNVDVAMIVAICICLDETQNEK